VERTARGARARRRSRGCDYHGTITGDTCGHYVNLRSPDFTQVACGASALGGWSAINFQ